MSVFISRSAEETKKVAAGFALTLQAGSVLALVGDLGSGKTCFVQGLAKGLAVPDTIPVSSPTFVLIHEYPGGKLPLFHFDFYRLEKAEEAQALSLEDYWEGNGVCVIEWADRFPKLFPEKTKWVHFKFLGENEREIRC
ncbi:MAG: tRNA (adenosine(37)-N6)-threonylcarbamoyltransferase complex ATPase subunit type 1 TsaE [Deltaproteobacteria bacterium RIFCSPLOWO2_12_FULL_44_12]|nr:MAG: tRNA (adenosine(37)-N6)-threonylcarbamoyltransferase complex ATPase subunit type 1 TsaE [Deltaproteobacteria bacterium RIFCSPHIGHO2_01_FULL_43_49]OGQ14248.1 MAG: tRNA (adenosine(37)-N6)-threonylcarbamoyltransferase complex ATPase subunit type 1 TsaE [Deltaproteobacteria bacterium RIFCSPHIGHO2_02_FULL_44_53]OGQ27464.1 MAG: tRNA (adenosine(37)-N6)-threonylcarbamoyltransferase complex ATPase subunit type 1 TsaE [Deltaproteobacteria bacterium RIFCSPHIGHO2_12_FULL_44_21]OGQ30712.1 MAG: tRNA (